MEESPQISITEAQEDAPAALLLSPPKVIIGNVNGGDIIEAPPLILQNGNSYDATIEITIEIPEGETTDINTGLTYEPAPQGFEQCMDNITGTYILPAHSKTGIPVVIRIPKGIKAPPRWEFNIKVAEADGGFVQTALIQRWLITMR